MVPITIIAAMVRKKNGGSAKSSTPPIPYFIGLFILASVLSTYVPVVHHIGPTIKLVAISGFALSLFLIGGGITAKTLKTVGVRPLIQGVALWAFISLTSLFVVLKM